LAEQHRPFIAKKDRAGILFPALSGAPPAPANSGVGRTGSGQSFRQQHSCPAIRRRTPSAKADNS